MVLILCNYPLQVPLFFRYNKLIDVNAIFALFTLSSLWCCHKHITTINFIWAGHLCIAIYFSIYNTMQVYTTFMVLQI